MTTISHKVRDHLYEEAGLINPQGDRHFCPFWRQPVGVESPCEEAEMHV